MIDSGTSLNLYVGVTAHRDLVPGEIPGIEKRVSAFLGELRRKFSGLSLHLITPLAEGGDQLAARVALEMDIPIVAVLPMEQSDYEQDFNTDQSLAQFRDLLAASSEVIVMPPTRRNEEMQASGYSSDRQAQYAQLGIFVSNHCQILLAIWDGKDGEFPGGTGNVLHYHLTGVLEGFADVRAADLLANNENDLAYHVVCSRERVDGSPAADLNPLDTYWITSQRGRETGRRIPPEYRLMLDRLEEFDADAEKYARDIELSGITLLDERPDLELPAGAHPADLFYRTADWLALHFQKRVRLSQRATYFLAAMMGLVFLVYSEYSGPSWMVLTFLALFFSGVALHLIGERRQWYRKYLDYRALAEGLRVQIYWNLSGVVNPTSAEFAYDSFLNKQDVEVGWIRHVMRSASMRRARGAQPDPGWVDWVVEQWVGNEGNGKGQLAYYSQRLHQNATHHRRTSILGAVCLWSGIAVAFLLLFFGSRASEEQMQIMLVLMGALPLIAAVRDAYAHKKAEKELIRQYDFMGRIFRNASKLLRESSDLGLKRRVLRALGEAALEEGAEWLLTHRERPLEYSTL